MAKSISDSIFGVIRKFELVLTRRAVLADKGYRCQYAIYGKAERHGVGGGLRFLTAFLVSYAFSTLCLMSIVQKSGPFMLRRYCIACSFCSLAAAFAAYV